MVMFYTVIVLCVIAVYVYYSRGRKQRVPSGLKDIPSETGLPVLGIVTKIGNCLCNYLLNLSHKHGPIYRIRFGMRDVVVLNTFEYIKAAMVDKGDTFSGRCKGLTYAFGSENAGLVFIDGNVWEEQKAFVLKSLREIGIGRAKSVEIVQEECIHLLEDLERLKGKRINMLHSMSMYSVNVMSQFVLRKRFSREDPELEVLEKYLRALLTRRDPITDFVLMFPFIESYESLIKFIFRKTSVNSLLDDCYDMFRKQIKEHLKNLDLNSEGNDFTDMFLINQHRLQESSGNVQSFTDFQLVRNILELLGPSYDFSATILWGFLFMAMYPDIQTKVYEEIINKIGNDRPITISDKISLTYTQAVMDEILRLGTVEPLGFIRRTLNDVNVKGYYIPKDTLVMPNVLACHLDSKTWENPLQFHPEHFLIRDDNGELKYKAREDVIPFSVGKRRCMGESIGRLKYFIFFTSIIRRFRVTSAVKITNFDILDPYEGILRTPKVQEFIFECRQ